MPTKKYNKDLSTKVTSAIFFSSSKNRSTNKKAEVSISATNSKNIMLGFNVPKDLCYKKCEDDYIPNVNIKVTLMSTWKIKCGIATYTSHLIDSINNVKGRELVDVIPFHKGKNYYKINNELLHLQHEFGIMPGNIVTKSKMLITFHTIYKDFTKELHNIEKSFNVVGYIAHFKETELALKRCTKKDVYLIPHGSTINPYVNTSTKSEIRRKLNFDKYGIGVDDKCAFMFGFQSGNKNFIRVIDACKNTGTKLIISGGKHECGYSNNINKKTKQNIVFLEKFLSDDEVDMFSFACDLLIFDYIPGKHYSCSGAMHRIIGSGNPIICSRVNHFDDIPEYKYCLKFSNQKELELKIQKALELKEEFSKKSIEYANTTSWDIVAKQHLDIYRKYVPNIDTIIINEAVVDPVIVTESSIANDPAIANDVSDNKYVNETKPVNEGDLK